VPCRSGCFKPHIHVRARGHAIECCHFLPQISERGWLNAAGFVGLAEFAGDTPATTDSLHSSSEADTLRSISHLGFRPYGLGGGVGRGRRVGRGLGVTLGVDVGLTLGEGVVVAVGVAVGTGVADGVGVTSGVDVGVAVAVGVGVGVTGGVTVGVTPGDGVGVGAPPGTLNL